MSINCIITGCLLVDKNVEKQISGDLFTDSSRSVYIFNASGCEWEDISPFSSQLRAIYAIDYFEKNNIFVIESKYAVFNSVAKNYLSSDEEDYLSSNDVFSQDPSNPLAAVTQPANEIMPGVFAMTFNDLAKAWDHSDEHHESLHVRLNGKEFTCKCGCYTFHRISPGNDNLLQCNACELLYRGT